jgi:hypothetical protein
VVLSGLILLVAPWLAERVLSGGILYLSILWFAAAGFLLHAAFLILKSWMGRAGAVAVLMVLTLSPVLLTAVPLPPPAAIHFPCPRNWTNLATWELRASPTASISFGIGTGRVKVCYGRPASRGRRMIGGRLVPFGRLWRTGANEPTLIITTTPLQIAGIPVPAGRASLYTVPGPETWEIILNSSTRQWGIESEYSDAVKARELGRAILPSEIRQSSLERLTFSVESRESQKQVDLVLRWENILVRIPISAGSR